MESGRERLLRRIRMLGLRAGVAFGLVGFLVVSSYLVGLWNLGGEDAPGAAIITVTQDHEGPALVSLPDDTVAALAETDMVRGRGEDQAADALQPAIDLMPFTVDVPSYMSGDLRLNMLAAHENSGKGFMQVFYGPPPPADGVYEPGVYQREVSLLWEPFDAADAVPRQEFSEEGTFAAGGRDWKFYVVNWPYYDHIEARTVTDEGMEITAWIRVIGMDEDTALVELQKIIASMEPAARTS